MGQVLELVKQAFDRSDANDLDGFIALQAPDCEFRTPDGVLRGHAAIREYVGRFRVAFPDGYHEIDRAHECGGSTVVIEGRWLGTHTGAFPRPEGEVPPTGRRVEMEFALVVDGDRDARAMTRVALHMDRLAMMAALGLLPEPAAA